MKNLILTTAMCLSIFSMNAQSNLTLYHMQSLPQVTYANPAHVSDSRFFIGFPGLSSVNPNISSNGLALKNLNDALSPIEGSDSFNLEVDKLYKIFNKDLYVNANISLDILHFGFRVGQTYWTFNVSDKVKTRVDVPTDLFELIFEGNGGNNLGQTFEFDPGIDLIHSREYALGIQHSLMDNRLRIGGRAKYLYGLNLINTKRGDMSFTTAEDDFTYLVTSDLEVNLASSVFSLDSNDHPDSKNWIYGANNHGLGLDLGISYDVSTRFTVSASLLDLGFINWKENVNNYQSSNPNAEFEFRGLDLKEYFQDSNTIEEGLAELTDSLAEIFGLDSSSRSFRTGLMSEFYIGGDYKLSKNHGLGVLFYGSFYNRKLYPAMTLSFNSRIKKILGLSVSYSIMKDNLYNLGLGLSINGGSFQYYMVSDNLIGNATASIKNIGVRTGINFTFGRRKWEQKLDEKPIEF